MNFVNRPVFHRKGARVSINGLDIATNFRKEINSGAPSLYHSSCKEQPLDIIFIDENIGNDCDEWNKINN